jgi:hypothetical protein
MHDYLCMFSPSLTWIIVSVLYIIHIEDKTVLFLGKKIQTGLLASLFYFSDQT